MCDCKSCVRSRAWNEIVETNDIEKLKDLIDEIRDILCYAEADLSMEQIILSGDWTPDVVRRRMADMNIGMKEY